MLRLLGKSGSAITAVFASLTLAPLVLPIGPIPVLSYMLPLHTALGTFSAIMAFLIFAIGWQSCREDRTGATAALCCLFLGSALLDLAHVFSYPGLPEFITANTYGKAAALALSSRVLAALALLMAALRLQRPGSGSVARLPPLAVALALSAAAAWLAIFHPDEAGAAYADGGVYIGIVLLGAFALAAGLYLLGNRKGDQPWLQNLAVGSLLLALAEVCFALSHNPADAFDYLGHLNRVAAAYVVYRAVFQRGVQLPMQQLRAQQAELALTKIAVDRASDYIYMTDPVTGRILYANQGACRRMGYTRTEIEAMMAWELNPNITPEVSATIAAQLRQHGSYRYESEHRSKSGERFPVEVTATLIRESGREFYYATVRDVTERKRMEAELADRTAQLRRVLDSMPYYISLLTTDGRFVEANRMVVDTWEMTEDDIRNMRMDDLMRRAFHATVCDRITESIRRAATGEIVQFDIQVELQPGGEEYSSYYIAPVFDRDGKVVNLVATSMSITDRVRAQNELKLASTVFDHSAEAILITDGAINVLSVNRAFTTLTGFEQDEVAGTVPPLFEAGKHLQSLRESLQATGNWSGEVEWLCKDGRLCFEWVTVTKVLDDEGEVSNYIVIFSDISEKKRTEEHIQYLAYYDPLTSLPNRVLLEDRVRQAIAAAKREDNKVAIIFLDLDHFKTINDSLGHHRGDKILAEVSKRLKRSVREMDTVARLGGDEFVIVLPRLREGEEAGAIGQKLLAELAMPYLIGGTELRLTVSIGVSIFPDDGADFSRLIMNADAAMYHAKAVGRNNMQFFIDEMNRRAGELLAMENRLRRAIERNEFILHYQPQVDLWSGDVVGMEALVRWNDPEQGMVPPGDFIPVAEERGLIGQIGDWVMREACLQNKRWQDAGLPPVPIAVNISASQFRKKNLIGSIRAVLEETGLEPHHLELEVTEGVVMDDAEQLIPTLEALRRLGVLLTVDDFGTGYSSLSYLKRFPIDRIKIDRSFVRDIPGDKDDYSIVRAIIGLAQQLGLKVVAEGVETEEQLDALKQSGCDQFQGFLFSRPLPAADIETLLRRAQQGSSRKQSPLH